MKSFTPILVLAVTLISVAYCHKYGRGRCPVIDGVHGFDMQKFSGRWYAIKKTKSSSLCLTYTFKNGSTADKYLMEQSFQNKLASRLDIGHRVKYVGKLTVKNSNLPGEMKVSFPLNFLGKASFIVVGTDYSNWGVIYTCQNLKIAHRLSVTVLSRTPLLDEDIFSRLGARYQFLHGVSLKSINQTNCQYNYDGRFDFNIDG